MIEIHTDFLHPSAAILLYQIIDVSKYNRIPASSHFIPQSFQRDVLKALACFDRAALQCWVGRHAESKLLKWEPHWVHVNLVLNGTSHHHHHRREIGRVFGGSLTCRVALRSSGSLWLKSQRLIGGRRWLNLGHILSLTRTLKLGWWKHLPTNQGVCWRCFSTGFAFARQPFTVGLFCFAWQRMMGLVDTWSPSWRMWCSCHEDPLRCFCGCRIEEACVTYLIGDADDVHHCSKLSFLHVVVFFCISLACKIFACCIVEKFCKSPLTFDMGLFTFPPCLWYET